MVFVFFGHVIKPQFFYFFQDWHTKDKHLKEQLTSDSLHIAQTVYTQVFSRRLVYKDGKTIIKISTDMISSTTYQLPSSVILSCLILQQNSTLIRCNLWTSSMENSSAKTGKFRWTLTKNVLKVFTGTGFRGSFTVKLLLGEILISIWKNVKVCLLIMAAYWSWRN